MITCVLLSTYIHFFATVRNCVYDQLELVCNLLLYSSNNIPPTHPLFFAIKYSRAKKKYIRLRPPVEGFLRVPT
jgi:hypothetical protein